MKKLIIGLGIAAMVMGMAVGVSASDSNWTILLQSGTTWNNTTKAITGGMSPITLGVKTTVTGSNAPSYFGSGPTTTQSGLWDVNPADSTGKRGQKDYRLYNAATSTYTWNLNLETGSAFDTAKTIYVAWMIPAVAEGVNGSKWTVKLYRGSEFVATLNDGTGYVYSKNSVTPGVFVASAGGTESWSLVASSGGNPVPEPGSMVAMLSGFAGLVGFGVRRRK